MVQVDFYLLHTSVRQEKEHLACQLVDKAWHQGYRIHVQTESITQAKRFDDRLWTFKDISFLPHDIYPDEGFSSAPIRIGYGEQAYEGNVLINLTEVVPSFFAQFARIVEIIDDTPRAREAGRNRYRFYQKNNSTLKVHEIYR